ncbi:Abi family protein [Roseibium aestuarii]|uniref:Abi family protein n=1 Tax=Roseibium aestuarii TaxID=2600299 RepID=A0ABW4K1A4_9HYPH|nr:Abi family protein [Roseibium aestuarii]
MTLEAALSTERLTKYRHWALQNNDDALALYALNVALSEAFYTSLHILEITLRNAIHDGLRARHGAGWFRNPAVITDRYQQQKVQEAFAKFQGQQPTDGQIVAELTFGFWTALFGRRNNHLWGQDLRGLFNAGKPLKRKQIASRLDDIRGIRNRIAHHEPIIQLDLEQTYLETCEITGWLSPAALAWCHTHCRFRSVHPGQPIIIGNLKNPVLPL